MDGLKQLGARLRREWIEFYNKVDWTYMTMISLVFIAYVLIHDLTGETFLDHNLWDSYALQTERWLQGHMDLDRNYRYLEIATYNGRFYISFPPFPSVLLIPWVLLYGYETPNNVIMIIYTMIALTLAYKLAGKFKVRKAMCAFWSIVVVLGCNMMWMSTRAGVWFQAQLINMILLLAAILAMLNNKRILSYICVACAVGCRPFSILYFFVLLVYYFVNDMKEYKEGIEKDTAINENKKEIKDKNEKEDKETDGENKDKGITLKGIKLYGTMLLKQFQGLISAAAIGMCYMLYNFARFDDPLEFGHNYLPEFLESKDGQFHTNYVMYNLYRMFIRGIKLKKNWGLEFTIFDGFWMYIANPIFLLLFACIILCIAKRIKKEYRFNPVKITILIMLVLNILCLCMHKTLGGWQFGNRYLVDLIPFVYLYILATKQQRGTVNKLNRLEILIGTFAVMFNVYGAVYMHIDLLLRN